MIKINKLRNKLKNTRSGQVAVVLILVFAITLIFYAVSLNLGKISQIKTLTTVASNQGASIMASQMASYGQKIFEEQMGGKRKICGWTGVMLAVITIVVVIIVIISCVYALCSGGWAAASLPGLYFALAVSVLNLALQVAVVQPGITEMWSDIISDTFSIKDSFLENAIKTGLMGAVTDNKLVPDMTDYDRDGLFWFDEDDVPRDMIGRFGLYYTARLMRSRGYVESVAIDDFQTALRDFLYEDTDDWGLFDPAPLCDTNPLVDGAGDILIDAGSAMCDPCCMPEFLVNFGDVEMTEDEIPVPIPLRGLNASGAECVGSEVEIRNRCENHSPYGAGYPWMFDPYREDDSALSFVSFRELIGRDDEHKDFNKKVLTPNGYVVPGESQDLDVTPAFELQDTEGFYGNPPDLRQSIHDFFYKMADWGVDLSDFSGAPDSCHWFSGALCNQFPMGGEDQLSIVIGPEVLYSMQPRVDGRLSNLIGNPPIAVDKVSFPINILANDDSCAQRAFDSLATAMPDTTLGFWKRGGDRYCSSGDIYPYADECEKHKDSGGDWCEVLDPVCFGTDLCTTDEDSECYGTSLCTVSELELCLCGEDPAADKTLWPDDIIDDLIYGLPSFWEWAASFLSQSGVDFEYEFAEWYPDVAEWIEPLVPDDGSGSNICLEDSEGNCEFGEGHLPKWQRALEEMIRRLEAWKTNNGLGYAGTNCNAAANGDLEAVWCIPPEQVGISNDYAIDECSGVSSGEQATFEVQGDPLLRGDLEDIVACLDWNVNDIAANGAVGNFDKFNQCGQTCSIADCSNLPRTLVPAYIPSAYDNTGDPLDELDIFAMLNCMDHCSVANCQAMPAVHSGDGTLYNFPNDDPLTFIADDCTGNIPNNNNGWLDAILLALQSAGPSCDLNPGGWLTQTRQSAIEAQVQVVKFTKRHDFLSKRLIDVDKILDIFQTARDKFYDFLTCDDNDGDGEPDGLACQLIKARVELADTSGTKTGLPYHAIYGWQSEPPDGRSEGYWHIVRVDARTPGRCDSACGSGGGFGSDPRWPRVKTYTKSWGMKRCYKFTDTNGMVKMRVTRFDEDRDPSNLTFPNGVPIWDFKHFHPSRKDSFSDATNLTANCRASMIKDPPNDPNTTSEYDHFSGAFMLDERIGLFDPEGRTENSGCWDMANNLLTRGITSETCAQYYFKRESNRGRMAVRFVNCPTF